MNSMRNLALPIICSMLFVLLQLSYGQMAPSPAPASPSNDGTAIDQGIAYFLLLVALAITYLFH
ncbi:Arabinogalactan protein 16/20/22/41 [Dillenia turbinata]|uniref:Arabinogalactan protein 16/20/22/41 n=1 Tax=Dillenia turbinata TaxID=194707 RepID=A0AAN8VWI5_9MAGN